MNKKDKKEAEWADAKNICRLSNVEIKMAKELGMTPKSLTKNIPTKSQKWKQPVKDWIRDLHETKFGETEFKSQSHIPPINRNVKERSKDRSEDEKIPKILDDQLPF
ncbi:hypothetical protein VQL36_04610 [Chengkuizengella sp. SCS-71B]|uniref:hypothetical protein n=1 Tax=Chengkuizengella sp. SCS-71B TaxID=3115290 RepID=UPI0032C224FF